MAAANIKMVIGVLFLAFSAAAFFTMLHLLGTPHTPHAKILRLVHRLTGGIAVGLYVIASIICIAGPLRTRGDFSATAAIHVAFSGLFIPLVLAKIIIVEKYPELRNRLFAFGTVLLTLAFVIVVTSASSYLAGGARIATSTRVEDPGDELSLGRDLFVIKCAKCHRLDRPLAARKTAEEWRQTVSVMRQKDRAWLGETEAERITEFLISLGGRPGHD